MHHGSHGKKLPTSATRIFFGKIGHELTGVVKGGHEGRLNSVLELLGLLNPFGLAVSALNARKEAKTNREINRYFEERSSKAAKVKQLTTIFEHPHFREILRSSNSTHLEIERSYRYLMILEKIIETKPQFAKQIEEIITKQQREAISRFYMDRRNLMDAKKKLDELEYEISKKIKAGGEISHEEEANFSKLVSEFGKLQKQFLSHFSYPQDSLLVLSFGTLQAKRKQLDKLIQDSSKQ